MDVVTALTELLEAFLQESALRSKNSECSRLVLGGLPGEVLEELFDSLTDSDGSPWQFTGGIQMPVFLVKRHPEAHGTGISRQCNWDYALAIRNSIPSFLLLVDPLVWDDRTYSIINATDTIGRPLPPIRRNVPALRNWSEFYANVVEMAAIRIGIDYSVVESALRQTLRDLPSLDPTEQHLLPWRIAEKISHLSDSEHIPTSNDLARVCGLLPFEHNTDNFGRSRVALRRLAEFLEGSGIDAGVEELKMTSRGTKLKREMDSIGMHLRNSAGSASAIVRAPSFYYAHATEDSEPSWWRAVTVEAVEGMLAEVGESTNADEILVSCIEPLNPSPSRGEPFLVHEAVSIKATHPNGAFQTLRILRTVGRENAIVLTSQDICQSPFTHRDPGIPSHNAPLTYTVEAHGATATTVQVISLDHFEPHGFVTCPGQLTRRISKPRRRRTEAPWKQEIFLRGRGIKVLRVYGGSTVTNVRITDPPEFQNSHAMTDGIADLELDLDDDMDVGLDLMDRDGQLVSAFVLAIIIDEDAGESVPSQFHALVRAHQDIKSTVPPPRSSYSWLRRVESQLLKTDASWRPVLATSGWAYSNPALTEERLLGRLQPLVDPRPAITPPSDFVEARGNVIDWLSSSQLPMPEQILANDDAERLVVDYLRAYREWSEHVPVEACWADTISILEPEPEQYGSHVVAASEPVAVLVSPLHPIRLGWQVAAQRVLSLGLESPCPLAGLLDPHRCPEVFPLGLMRSGGAPRWKAYISISCQDPMWGLFWDSARLRDMQHHEAVAELLASGAVPRGIQSGFTASQARKTLEEVGHVLPTRAILRIGIVGSGQGNTSCTDGLSAWSRELYGNETEVLTGPRSIELYDSRRSDSQPSSEEVSGLADDTEHHIRWYSSAAIAPVSDLVIVDHLGSASPVNEVHSWMSPSTAGSLIRPRIRLDRNDAEIVIESRAGTVVRSEDGLLDELSLAIGRVEALARSHGKCSHIAFMPNRQVLSGELNTTRFLAVSSTEIDPACFARGTPQAGGFLWDYELPHAIGLGEQRGGFYLLARPPEAIRRAVLRAIRIMSQSTVDLDALLIETSRRGIPILKRLAAGGSLARGELGMLLAVRLLQDSFRGQGRTVRLPVYEDGTVRMLLPVDPYAAPLEKLRQGLCKANPSLQAATRPDLLVACIEIDSEERTGIQLVPLEVKFREGRMSASARRDSLAQANSLGKILHHLLRVTPLNELWRMCGLGFLSEILDHGFRVYGDPSVNGVSPDEWVKIHQTCLSNIAGGRVTISIAEEGRLIVFDDSPYSHLYDTDEDGRAETLVVCREDGRGLLEDGLHLSDCVDQVARLLDICHRSPEMTATAIELEGPTEQPAEVSDESNSNSVPSVVDAAAGHISESEPSVVPIHVRERASSAFSGFIGNRAAVDTLRRGILRALLSEPPQLAVSYLLTGNPSTGKTELARRVALSLALPFVSLDGRGLASRERLFDLIDGRLLDTGQNAIQIGTQYQLSELEYPPLVVFVDEIHLVPRSVQESLLTALEPKDRSVLLADRVAKLPAVTFLFATTRPSEVDMAFRTRCTEVPLQDYTEEEVASIVRLEHPEWPEPLRRRIARYGRLVPRIALEVARELADEALVSEHRDRDLYGHLDEVRRTRLIDENGLGRIDIEYLELLDREDKPLGERNILTMLGNIDKDRFIEEVEPLLVARMRLVRRTGRGREITPEGHRYLIEVRRMRADSV